MRRRFHPLPVFALAFGAGCALFTSPTDGVFRGIYINGFETSAFRQCGADRAWWTEGELGPVYAAWEADGPVPPGEARAAYLVVRGRRSRKGSYGHLSSYPYELRVDSVLDVHRDTTGACR